MAHPPTDTSAEEHQREAGLLSWASDTIVHLFAGPTSKWQAAAKESRPGKPPSVQSFSFSSEASETREGFTDLPAFVDGLLEKWSTGMCGRLSHNGETLGTFHARADGLYEAGWKGIMSWLNLSDLVEWSKEWPLQLPDAVGHLELLTSLALRATPTARRGELCLEAAQPVRLFSLPPGGVPSTPAPRGKLAAHWMDPYPDVVPMHASKLCGDPVGSDAERSSQGGEPEGEQTVPCEEVLTRDFAPGTLAGSVLSLEVSALRLLVEAVPGPSGKWSLRCSASTRLQAELPKPWYVPTMGIEAAANFLLRLGLGYSCTGLIDEIQDEYEQWRDAAQAKSPGSAAEDAGQSGLGRSPPSMCAAAQSCSS